MNASTWAQTLVSTLAACGVRQVCLSPGARSAPLAIACEAHPDIETLLIIDERSAAFFAVGLARATGAPVALVCSSGTAGANYHPAVVEASMSGLPLIVLTADRPARLHGLGAPQTIDQQALFGGAVRRFVSLPEASPQPQARRALARQVAMAVASALGPEPGPVHLNCPFDEPLTGPVESEAGVAPRVHAARPLAGQGALEAVAARLQAARRPLLIAGPDAGRHGAAPALLALAEALAMPVVADVGSGLRGEETCAFADLFLRLPAFHEAPPDMVLLAGGAPTAKGVLTYLQGLAPGTIALQPDARPHDAEALADCVVIGDVADAVRRLTAMVETPAPASWLARWREADRRAEAIVNAPETPVPFEARAVRAAIAALPTDAALCLSNSLPIRHADTFGGRLRPGISVHVYRGANGIDGVTSMSLGVARGLGRPTLLVTGDLAFMHDLGGLAAARHLAGPMVVLLLNNDGGGIFSYLPLASATPRFEELFGTPHGLSFGPAAALFGLGYARATSVSEIEAAVRQGLGAPGLTVIEVPSERSETVASFKACAAAVAEALSEVTA
ncbi:MAG: 2-succinyl-5-enolpyruvyl-6-hydroxy-3-cyclohexene-1-carboxylic-acid synthase [Candidatus Sericytochromatia bacterium]